MKQKCVVFVESNTSGTGRTFANAARAFGFVSIVLSANPGRYPFLHQDGIESVLADTADAAAVLASCRALEASYSIAGITSSSEYFIAIAAATAASMGLPGPDPQAIRECRDKSMQRAKLAGAGVCVPAFRVAGTMAEAAAAAGEIGYPVVVKPLTGSGSVGVHMCRHEADVRRFAAQLVDSFVNERGMAADPRVLIEGYLEGIGYSVETFGNEVVGVTRKHAGKHCAFVATGHDFPAEIDAAAAGKLETVTREALRALDLGWGPAHTELCYTKDGPAIVEVNPRLAGAMIPELIRLAIGRNLVEETLALATETPSMRHDPLRRYAAIRFLVPQRKGTLTKVTGLDSAQKMPGVVALELNAAIGSMLQINGDFRDKIGYIITQSCAPGSAGPAAEKAIEQIVLCVQ